jgi:DNA-binding GntR family transcriptional regulator
VSLLAQPLLTGAPAPATDRAYLAVLDAVVSGTAAPGALLSEVEMAGHLGLSRTPVRAAFVRLAAEGLLTLYPRRGAVVTALEGAQSRDLLETRVMLETTAVRWLAEGGVPQDLGTRLRHCLTEQERAAAGDSLAFAKADQALHDAVVAAPGNRVAAELFTLCGPRLLRLLHRAAERGADVRRRLVDEHAELAGLALAADADGYAALLRRHVGVHDEELR